MWVRFWLRTVRDFENNFGRDVQLLSPSSFFFLVCLIWKSPRDIFLESIFVSKTVSKHRVLEEVANESCLATYKHWFSFRTQCFLQSEKDEKCNTRTMVYKLRGLRTVVSRMQQFRLLFLENKIGATTWGTGCPGQSFISTGSVGWRPKTTKYGQKYFWFFHR